MKKILLLTFLASFFLSRQAQANLLVDGDFSSLPATSVSNDPYPGGSATPSIQSNGTTKTSFAYVQGSGTVTGIGGAGGWTAYNGTSAANSAVYFENTVGNTSQTWIPGADLTANPNGYVVQLDTISTPQAWTTGNALAQTVTVTAGQDYALTFSINTESGGGKANTSGADIMITNAGSFKAPTATTTISSAGTASNSNAHTYGGVTGYQYTVTTTGNGATATSWDTYTIDFTATSNSTTIYLADDPISANSNISLEAVSLVTVPEPRREALLLLLGVAGLVTARRLFSPPPPRRAPVGG